MTHRPKSAACELVYMYKPVKRKVLIPPFKPKNTP
uniref:Uncharacterized protein n=1 Tax=Anguilla anguilla TaxID=7936 RepID=A0A0E9XY80_ANGAN